MFRGQLKQKSLKMCSCSKLKLFSFQDVIEVDAETKEMLKMIDFQSIPWLQMTRPLPTVEVAKLVDTSATETELLYRHEKLESVSL